MTNSRLNSNTRKNTIVKALFLRKKQQRLNELIGDKVSFDTEDSVILEHLDNEERDLVDFI